MLGELLKEFPPCTTIGSPGGPIVVGCLLAIPLSGQLHRLVHWVVQQNEILSIMLFMMCHLLPGRSLMEKKNLPPHSMRNPQPKKNHHIWQKQVAIGGIFFAILTIADPTPQKTSNFSSTFNFLILIQFEPKPDVGWRLGQKVLLSASDPWKILAIENGSKIKQNKWREKIKIFHGSGGGKWNYVQWKWAPQCQECGFNAAFAQIQN